LIGAFWFKDNLSLVDDNNKLKTIRMPTMNGKIATSNSGNVENAHWKHLEGALGCIGMFFSFWVKGAPRDVESTRYDVRRHHQC